MATLVDKQRAIFNPDQAAAFNAVLESARGLDENLVYYVRETERGMMAADSELTKQLCHMTLLFTQKFYKIQINSE